MHRLSRAIASSFSFFSTASHVIIDRRPPPDLGKWGCLKQFVWDREKRTFCNRTAVSWGNIILFYGIFFTLLLGVFFLAMLGSTHYIRDYHKKPWINKMDILKNKNPGMSFIPNTLMVSSPIISYTTDTDAQSSFLMNADEYINYIDKYLKTYNIVEERPNDYNNCINYGDPGPCAFKRSDLGPCGKNDFGYRDKKPCIYIKMNQAAGWEPGTYFLDELPQNMPGSVKSLLAGKSGSSNNILIECRGMFPSDDEHVGKMSYYPQQTIESYYFPYEFGIKYLTPLVAVKLDNIKPGYIVNIVCSAWSGDLETDKPEQHSVYIEIFIDDA